MQIPIFAILNELLISKAMKLHVISILSAAIALTSCGSKTTDSRTQTEIAAPDTVATELPSGIPADTVATELPSEIPADTVATDTPAITLHPVTQYSLVTHNRDGAAFREGKNMASILRNLGFTVKTYKSSDSDDDMSAYTILTASRKGVGGQNTTITFENNGEDNICTIDFADEAERDAFVESMVKAGYKKDGHIYANPRNMAGMNMIYAKVNGRRITMIHPWEMLPSTF